MVWSYFEKDALIHVWSKGWMPGTSVLTVVNPEQGGHGVGHSFLWLPFLLSVHTALSPPPSFSFFRF